MPKTFDTHTYTVGTLLGRYERRQVILPTFQRSYSWEKTQVLNFLNDLLLFEKEFVKAPNTASYFLGSIVLIEREENLLLLDGQQRLATATIILAAMRDISRTLDKDNFKKGGDLARDIQRELIEKDTEPVSSSLVLGELDEPYFHSSIKSDPPLIPQSKMRSHQLMQAAYNQACEYLRTTIQAKTNDEAVRILKAVRDALSKGMTMIGIIVQNEEDAYTIFETLNDRGLRLSVPDLVLNLLMRRAQGDTARRIIRQHWNAMLRELGRRDVSRFLRHLWVSKYGDLKSEGLFAAIRKELEESKINSIAFAELCADECDDYVALLDANIPLSSKEDLRNLEGIVKYLQIASAPPLLLAAYRSLSTNDFEKLLKTLISVYIRYIVVSNQNPLDFESKMYESARIIRYSKDNGLSSSKILSAAKQKLKELFTSDDSVRSAFKSVYLDRTEAIWLMTILANNRQSKTREIGMDKANLEHIFPQNPTLKDWPNASEFEGLVWNIGNLTILGERINRKAQNKNYQEKLRDFYSRSEIDLTKDLLNVNSWTVNEIHIRAKKLVDQIIKIWPIEN